MDSGKFSSAAVNRLLKHAGANRAIPEFRSFKPASCRGVIESHDCRVTRTGSEYGDEEKVRAKAAGGVSDFPGFFHPSFSFVSK
jgi:hypothetical protein